MFCKKASQILREASGRLATTTADYFATENPLLATRAEAERFGTAVADLRDAVERLAKRLERLENR